MIANRPNEKPIKHIIWDWNGTLFNDAKACVRTLNVILKDRGLPLVNLEQYREIFRFPVKEYYEILGFDFTAEEWDAMAVEFHAIYFDISREMDLRQGITGVLEKLQSARMPMSVLSAAETASLERLLCEHGIRHYFEHVEGLSDIYASSKMEAGRTLIGKLELPPESVLMVGDTTHDHEVASALGCACVLLSGGHQAGHRLKQCGCRVLDLDAEGLNSTNVFLDFLDDLV